MKVLKCLGCVMLAGILLLSLPMQTGAEEMWYHWYCKRNHDGTPPALPGEMAWMKEEGGVYRLEEADEDDKVIYLTFDAGYCNENLVSVLETLRKHDAQGAFFVLKHLIKSETELVKQMIEDGHLVCNHTSTHPDMQTVKERSRFEEELCAMERLGEELLGTELDRFYRPPQGTFSRSQLSWAKEMGYTTVLWSLAYADWDNDKQPDAEGSFELLMNNTHNGMILLLHPTSKTNAAILDRLLTRWEEMGYRFGSLYELTGARS